MYMNVYGEIFCNFLPSWVSIFKFSSIFPRNLMNNKNMINKKKTTLELHEALGWTSIGWDDFVC